MPQTEAMVMLSHDGARFRLGYPILPQLPRESDSEVHHRPARVAVHRMSLPFRTAFSPAIRPELIAKAELSPEEGLIG